MKKLVILFCLFLLSDFVQAQTDCAVYHTGYFKYIDSTGNTILIHRKNKYQFENNRKTKVKTQFAIAWINDCEYSLTQALTNSKSQKKYKNSVSKTVISKSDGGNGYYYTCSCIDDTLKSKENFMKKITKQEYYEIFYAETK